MKLTKLLIAAATIALCANACKDKGEHWTVNGSIEGAGGKMLYVEAPNVLGRWYVVDSVSINDDGSFLLEPSRPEYPEIYRLKFGNDVVYIPVDSTESFTFKASADDIASYTIEGSYAAQTVADISHKINKLVKKGGTQAALADSVLKKEMNGIIVGDIQNINGRNDASGMLAYYLVAVCNVDGKPMFDPANPRDLRIIGAVANDFKTNRPDDPRTKMLERLYVSNRKPTRHSVIEVPEAALPEFKLCDQNNEEQSITALTSQGKVTLLNFTSYDIPETQYFNDVLNGLYSKYGEQGFEIVQVALAGDPYSWAHGRKGLPWVTLYAPSETAGTIMMQYQVSGLPTWYIVDRKGDLRERVNSVEELRSAIEKYL